MNAQQEKAAYDELDAALSAEKTAALLLAAHIELHDRLGFPDTTSQRRLISQYRAAMHRREDADAAVQALR